MSFLKHTNSVQCKVWFRTTRASNRGHNSIVKFSYVKEILIKEFAEDVGFPTAAWKSGINAIRVLSLDLKTSSSRRKLCNLKFVYASFVD